MAGTLTPTLVLAQAGLVQNQGLQISPTLLSRLTTYQTTTVTGNLHFLVNTVTGTPAFPQELIARLRDVMPGLAGLSHISNPRLGINANCVASSVVMHAGNLYQNTGQFAGLLSSVSGFCSQAFAAAGPMAEAASKSFSDYDFNIKNYGDMLNGGISNIFNPRRGTAGYTAGIENAASQDTTQLKNNLIGLAKGLRGIGTMYDATDLYSFGEPYGLIQSLQKQGLADAGLNRRLVAAGLDPTDISQVESIQLRAVLKDVTDSELTTILNGLNFTPPGSTRISSLDDLLEAKKIFPAESLPAIRDEKLEGLRNQLITMGGSFASFGAIASYLEGVEVKSFGNLDNLTSPLPADAAAAAAEFMPKGSGPFGNPTILDCIGTASGHKHVDALTDIIDVAQEFGLTQLCTNLNAAIANVTVAVGLGWSNAITYANANITSVIDSIDASTDTQVVTALTVSRESIKTVVEQLALELDNLDKAGIDLKAPATGVSQIYGLVQNLHSYGLDAQGNKVGTMLENMAKSDQYGDAIRAGLQEGKTIARNDAANLRNVTKMDPEKYAQSLSGS